MGDRAPQAVCIGGATVDRKLRTLGPLRPETSNPVRSERAFGGVARNVAEGLARLGVATALVSLVGDDEAGRSILRDLQAVGVETRSVAVAKSQATAEYLAVLPPSGDLAYGFAEMGIFDAFSVEIIEGAASALATASVVFADCNLPGGCLEALLRQPRSPTTRLAVDAVSTPKVRKLPRDLRGLDLLFLNVDEAQAYLDEPATAAGTPEALAAALIDRGLTQAVLTRGADGLVIASREEITRIPAVPAGVVDATGAGDALIATILAGLVSGEPLRDAARRGTLAAALTIESPWSVRPDLSPALLAAQSARIAPPPDTRSDHD